MRSHPKSKVVSDPRHNFGRSGVDPKGRRSCDIPILVPYIQKIHQKSATNEAWVCICRYADFTSYLPAEINFPGFV